MLISINLPMEEDYQVKIESLNRDRLFAYNLISQVADYTKTLESHLELDNGTTRLVNNEKLKHLSFLVGLLIGLLLLHLVKMAL